MATKSQIKRIHMLKSRLGIDESTYREMLSGFGVLSSKEMNYEKANELLKILEFDAIPLGLWEQKPLKYENFNRENMATPSQLRLIMGLWREDTTDNDHDSQVKLWKFLYRQFKISDITFLTKDKVSAVIHAIKQMKIYYKNKSVAAQS